MWKIRDLTFTCPLRNVDFETGNAFTFHLADQHPDGGSLDESLEKVKTFNNVLFISGLCHLEMKIVNCLFTLLWDVGLESLAKLLGFKSPIALIQSKKASDNHKSFTILSIFFNGLMDELMLPYIKQCHDCSTNVIDFEKWVQNVTHPNYKLLYGILFGPVLGLMLFRTEICFNDNQLIQASRLEMNRIFYCKKHPKYQAIELKEQLIFMNAPKLVNDFLMRNLSLANWSQWLRICRNIDKLDQVIIINKTKPHMLLTFINIYFICIGHFKLTFVFNVFFANLKLNPVHPVCTQKLHFSIAQPNHSISFSSPLSFCFSQTLHFSVIK